MSETGNTVIIKWLEQAVNRYVSLDPEMPGKIAGLSGSILCLDITGMDRKIYLLPDENGITLAESCELEADATIKGTPLALMKMNFLADTEPLLLKGEVEITGDTRLAKKFKHLIDDMDIDWEDLLASRVGDVVAHRVFDSAKKISNWGRYLGNALIQDLSEYLQEESRDVVTASELEIFNKAVDRLRDDTDRLAARIERLTTNRVH